jgi:hypothetical protein
MIQRPRAWRFIQRLAACSPSAPCSFGRHPSAALICPLRRCKEFYLSQIDWPGPACRLRGPNSALFEWHKRSMQCTRRLRRIAWRPLLFPRLILTSLRATRQSHTFRFFTQLGKLLLRRRAEANFAPGVASARSESMLAPSRKHRCDGRF